MTLRDIRRHCISQPELERSVAGRMPLLDSNRLLLRISQLEMLDEIEELELVLQHYAITWGVKANDAEAQAAWKAWGFIHT